MCTVTYIPKNQNRDFVLTSNRDERVFRPAIAPKVYKINGVELCFPKDSKAGGSWIATNNNGRLCCLLNGGVVAHQKQNFHTQSRGKVLLDMAKSKTNAKVFFETKNLAAVEPFTMITVDWERNGTKSLTEFIWDGKQKHFREPDKSHAHIWSSVTLYSEGNRKLREKWFQQFIAKNNGSATPEKIFAFHSGKHTSDNSINLVMEREGGLKTVSITQVTPKRNHLVMNYCDLVEKSHQEIAI